MPDDKNEEIEITPAMIEAGESALASIGLDSPFEEIARAVYRAMSRAKEAALS